MRLIVFEDDPFIGEDLRQIVGNQRGIAVELVSDRDSFIARLEARAFDAAFLDIRIHGKDMGIECGTLLAEHGIPFCFITSFSGKDTLRQAVGTGPTGYLLKPFTHSEVIEELKKLKLSVYDDQLVVRSFGKDVLLKRAEIMYLMSENIYINIIHSEGTTVVRGNMKEVTRTIGTPEMIRIHRSYAVNLHFVKSIGTQLTLKNGQQLPISRKYKPEVARLIANM